MTESKIQSIIHSVEETILSYDMRSEGPVLVAVSGGSDSVFLLHALLELGESVEVGHIDHGTREGRSAEDAAWVQELSKSLGLPFHGTRVDVKSRSKERGQSFQEAARMLRYGFLVETARETKCRAIATGHQRDDVAETVLLRVLRGVSPHGLSAIPPVGDHDGIPVIRPLINLARADIISYLSEKDIAYLEDESNRSVEYERNRLRHELLPLLAREYNPRIRDALVRIAESHRVEDGLLSELAAVFSKECLREEETIDREAFRKGHEALQRRVVAMLCAAHDLDIDHSRIVNAVAFILEAPTGKRFDLTGGYQLVNGRDHTRLLEASSETSKESACPLDIGAECHAFGRTFLALKTARDAEAPVAERCTPKCQVFDARACSGGLIVRKRRPGDRFTPLGMTGSKKVSEYLSDLGVPLWERNDQLVLASGDEILWVVGHAMSAKAAISADTIDVVVVEISDAP